jgi:ribosome biogenesis GTPase A
MSIQWFPGHMHLTKKAITARVKDGIDVVIELLDARAPGSSANPLLAQLTQGKPALKVLNKQDLADPVRTELWLAHYNSLPATQALALDASITAPAQRLITACRTLAPLRGGMAKPMRVLICGIPNVGKSTLINTLVGKRAAKTGDEPGITKLEQRIALASDFYLYDTPGMLWPKITIEKGGYKLADTAALNDEELLAAIGRKRGAVLSGGKINLQKAAETVIHDYRSGILGRITLETPAEFLVWAAEAEIAEQARQARKARKGRRGAKEAPGDEGDEGLDDGGSEGGAE